MFDNVRLEKGLYNLAGKTFLDVLEEQDPSENYIGTPMEKLDAFERQLKRFDIKLNGKHCDKVEKFFTTTETAILFPEYIKRCVIQGIEDSHFEDLIAVKTIINGTSYRGTYIEDNSGYDTTNPGVALPDANIYENWSSEILTKMGRVINAPYEVVRQQNLNIFSVQLRIIGRRLGKALYSKVLSTIGSHSASVNANSSTLTYDDLLNLYSQFTEYDMNVIVASPAICAKILSLSEVKDCCCTQTVDNGILLPFGAKLIKSTSVSNNSIYAIDKNFAIEYVTSTELFMETDNIINRQLDCLSVTTEYLFRCIESSAMKTLTIPTT